MGTFIKNLIQFVAFFLFLGCIGWFIAFNLNVYSVCADHPQKKSTHLICKPGGFIVEKPEPEKKFRDGKF